MLTRFRGLADPLGGPEPSAEAFSVVAELRSQLANETGVSLQLHTFNLELQAEALKLRLGLRLLSAANLVLVIIICFVSRRPATVVTAPLLSRAAGRAPWYGFKPSAPPAYQVNLTSRTSAGGSSEAGESVRSERVATIVAVTPSSRRLA